MIFTPAETVVAIVDVQGRLAERMADAATLLDALRRLVAGVRAMGVPILWTEQNPERMGPTVGPLRDLLADLTPIPKMSFSCCGEPAFMRALEAHPERRSVVLAGIECHVCIYQTAAHLLARGYAVQIPADAVGARATANRDIALQRLRAGGADITCVESVLFELLRSADHPAFREVLRIVK